MHATVCDIISDLVQNAVEAGATRVELKVATGPERVEVRVRDNGKGMDAAGLVKARDPFHSEPGKHAGRRVGLGIPLLEQTAAAANGGVSIESTPGVGTTVAFELDARHLDTPPLGDLPATLLGLMNLAGDSELAVLRESAHGGYAITSGELRDALGDLEQAGNLILARDYLVSQEENLDYGE